jgi:hypothetical protein
MEPPVRPKPTSQWKDFVILCLVITNLFFLWLVLTEREVIQFSPHELTFAKHLESMPEPEEYRIYSKPPDSDRLVVIGPSRKIWVASGPPVYIFDRDGRLRAWTIDSGDDSRFMERWGGFWSGPKIDRATAEAWVTKAP